MNPLSRPSAIATITTNPYQLAIDIFGIGFITADTIAQKVGVSPNSPYRYQAGVLHVLGTVAEDGHCFLPLPELINESVALLSNNDHEANRDAVSDVVQEMVNQENLVVETAEGNMSLVYKPTFFYSEQHLAKLIKQQLQQPNRVDSERVKNWRKRNKFVAHWGFMLLLTPRAQRFANDDSTGY